MNRDEIIKLAFKAGMHVVDREDAYFLKRFAALVAERKDAECSAKLMERCLDAARIEREQCAAVCEAQAAGLGQTREAGIAGICAAAIRGRKG